MVVTFITWIAFILLEQKINLNPMKKYVKIKINNCGILMLSEKDNVLEFNLKSDKMLYIFYADIESLI